MTLSVIMIMVWPTFPIMIGMARPRVLRLSSQKLNRDNFLNLGESFFQTHFDALLECRRRTGAARASAAHVNGQDIIFVFVKNNIAAVQGDHGSDFVIQQALDVFYEGSVIAVV